MEKNNPETMRLKALESVSNFNGIGFGWLEMWRQSNSDNDPNNPSLDSMIERIKNANAEIRSITIELIKMGKQ